MTSILSYLLEAAYPNADRDGTATSEPYRTLHLVGLIRTVIEYGRHLIITARQCTNPAEFAAFAAPFGTASLKLLLARIGCAISRAVHLEQKLQYQAGLHSIYRPAPARPAPKDRAPRPRPAAAPARSRTDRTKPARDPDLAHLPTVAQIAAEIRRLPLEQVIATICRDLGIAPDHELWQQLNQAVAAFGVSLPVSVSEHDRARKRATKQRADAPPHAQPPTAPAQPPPPNPTRQAQAPLCTGPPEFADNRAAA